MQFDVSFFSHARENTYEQAQLSYTQLVERLTTFRVAETDDKASLPAWSPTLYAPGTPRGKANVLSLSCLVLDYDDGTTIRDASQVWSDWPHIIHTSWSHTEEHAKFRLVLPLDEPIPASAWPRVWAWAYEHAGRHIDAACKDASRIYFLPALRSASWPHHHIDHDYGGAHLLHIDHERLPPTQDEQRRERLARRRPPRVKHRRATTGNLRRLRAEELKVNPSARESLGIALGAHMRHDRATRITCPGCSRPSVWYWLEPEKAVRAYCDHRNSCGWAGWLDVLEASR